MEPLALTIAQAAKLGGPCRSALYQDIRAGRLRAIKRGRSTRILLEDFKAYLASMPPLRPTVAVDLEGDRVQAGVQSPSKMSLETLLAPAHTEQGDEI